MNKQQYFHQILIIQNTFSIVELIFKLAADVEEDDVDVRGFFLKDESVSLCFSISFWGSSFPGGNKKHCSSLRFGVVVPCHGEGSGISLPSQ